MRLLCRSQSRPTFSIQHPSRAWAYYTIGGVALRLLNLIPAQVPISRLASLALHDAPPTQARQLGQSGKTETSSSVGLGLPDVSPGPVAQVAAQAVADASHPGSHLLRPQREGASQLSG